jgi:hypothetical protein
MSIEGKHNVRTKSVRRSGMILSGEALVEFRSFELIWRGFCSFDL